MENKESAEDEIDLLELWAVLWKRRKFIGIFIAAAVFAAAAISFLMRPVYKSSATVIPLTPASGASSILSSAANFLPISLPHSRGTDKILAVLHSRTIREMVIKRLHLIPLLIKNKNEKRKLLKSAAILKKSVIIGYDKKLGVIKISALNEEPKLAQEIAAAYVSELGKILNGKALTMSAMNARFIKKQMAKTKTEIKKTMSEASAIQNKYGLTLPSGFNGPVGKDAVSFYSIFQKGGGKFSNLFMRLNFLREKYASLEKMYQEEEYKSIKNNLYVQVLDEPVIPYKPFKPHKILIIAAAGVSSLFLSVFLALLLNYADNLRKTRVKPE